MAAHTWKRFGGADCFLKHRVTVVFASKCDVFVSRPVFVPLAVVDIGSRRIPAKDLSGLVQQWVVPDQEPAILTILSHSPLLVFERNGAGKRFVPFFAKPLNVIGMENTRAKIVGYYFLLK